MPVDRVTKVGRFGWKAVVVAKVLLGCAAAASSGCALLGPNPELYASLGMRNVHQHRESQRTFAAPPCAGLIALWKGCPGSTSSETAGASDKQAESEDDKGS